MPRTSTKKTKQPKFRNLDDLLQSIPKPDSVSDEQLRHLLIQLLLDYPSNATSDPNFKGLKEKHAVIKTLYDMNHAGDDQSSGVLEALADAFKNRH